MFDLVIENVRVLTVSPRGTISRGAVAIKAGRIAAVGAGSDFAGAASRHRLDGEGLTLAPGLVDCHSHLMEYATAGVHRIGPPGQAMAGVANLFRSRCAGIVANGEHHLGHPVLAQETQTYIDLASLFPGKTRLAAGFCILGTDPLAVTASARPGEVLTLADLGAAVLEEAARHSQFPGESLFLTATVANLPPHLVPRAGELCLAPEQIRAFVRVFHDRGKRVGAHVEGEEGIRAFLDAGGDVLHHAHGLTPDLMHRVASAGVALVATPHGGTGRAPSSPAEIARAVAAGIQVAIATDAYLPKHPGAVWLEEPAGFEYGPDHLLALAHPVFRLLREQGRDENAILALITRNAAEILDLDGGSIEPGRPADLVLADGIPGLEVTGPEGIRKVFVNGGLFRDG
ncbi:MAG: amidohydrolase family protein [bacterium]|nr:amidohydrolase family protein [bacterium]